MDNALFQATVASAACAALLGFLLVRVVMHRSRQGLTRASESRRAAWPWPWRLHRPLACFLGQLCSPLLATRLQARRNLQLRRAELDGVLDARDWFGLALCNALIAALVSAWLMGMPAAGAATVPWSIAAGAVAYLLTGQWLANRAAEAGRSVLRELPSYMDMLTLAVEGGCTLVVAIRLAVEKAPPSALRHAFEAVLREVRAGRARSEALDIVCRRLELPGLTEVSTALAQAESSGMSLGSILRSQAEQRSNERFARAERLAMEAPVKMLAPLILCIFPCTFIVIGFPVAVRLMGQVS